MEGKVLKILEPVACKLFSIHPVIKAKDIERECGVQNAPAHARKVQR